MYNNESFGEQALYFNSLRQCTVKAIEETTCLALGRDALTKIFGDKIQIIIYRNIQRWAFDKSEILKNLLLIQREKIIESMKLKNFKKGEIIFEKIEKVNKIVFILEGSLIKKKVILFCIK